MPTSIDLNNARSNAKRRGEALFYDLEYATVSDDWSQVPRLLDELEGNEEYLKTFSHFGGGWTKGLLIAVDRADIALKMLELSLERDPLNRRTNIQTFIFLAATNKLDSAVQLANRIRKESGESLPFGLREIQILSVQGKFQEVIDRTENLENVELYRIYAQIQVGTIDQFDESTLGVLSPQDRYFMTFIYRALGQQEKADSLAKAFDSQYLGTFGLSDTMVSNTGKIAFNLTVTPKLVAQLREAGIDNLDEYQRKHLVVVPTSN